MMFWYGHHMGAWGWFAMSLGLIVFWLTLITAAVAVFRLLTRDDPPASPQGPRSDAEDILAERFARGEIDEDEYQQRLHALRSRPPASLRR